jgi:hypothetical protein
MQLNWSIHNDYDSINFFSFVSFINRGIDMIQHDWLVVYTSALGVPP